MLVLRQALAALLLFNSSLAIASTIEIPQSGGGGGGNIESINGNTTAAQIIQGVGTVSVESAGGTTTVTGMGSANGLNWLNAWDNATNYVENDTVVYGGIGYVCTANNHGGEPDTHPELWQALAPDVSTAAPNTFAGYDSAGTLGAIPGWSWDDTTHGLNATINYDTSIQNINGFVTYTQSTPTAANTSYTTSNLIRIDCNSNDPAIGCGTPGDAGGMLGLSIQVNATTQSSAYQLSALGVQTNLGDGADAISVDQVFPLTVNTSVQSGVTVNAVQGFTHNLQASAGSLIGDTSLIRDYSSVDHYTGDYSGYEVRQNINVIDGDYFGFTDNNNLTTVGQNYMPYNVFGVWQTMNGYTAGFSFQPTINGDTQGVNAFASESIVPADVNQHWSEMDLGTQFSGTLTEGWTGISAHVSSTGTITADADLIEDGSSFVTIARNANVINLHETITTLAGTFSGMTENSHITALNGNYNGLSSTPQVDHLASSFQGLAVDPNITEIPLAAGVFTVNTVADVNGSLTSKYFSYCEPYTDGNACWTPWFKVSGTGTGPSIGGHTNIEVDISTNDDATTVAGAVFNAVTAVTPSVSWVNSGNGLLTATMADEGAGNPASAETSGFTVTITTVGGGDGSANGINIDMSNAHGFEKDQLHAIQFNGGSIEGNVDVAVASGTGNPDTINNINTNLDAAASSTFTNSDSISFGPISSFHAEHDSHTTSGPLHVGSVSEGKIGLLQLDDSSTVEDIGGDLIAQVLVGGSGAGGTVTNAYGVLYVAGNEGSPSSIVNARAFYANDPLGPPATNAWALYAKASYQNYMGGSLKVGGAPDGTHDKVASPSIGLEVEGLETLFEPMSQTVRDALTPSTGALINNSTSGNLERYDGTAWRALSSLTPQASAASPTLLGTTDALTPVGTMVFIASSGGIVISTANPQVTGCSTAADVGRVVKVVGSDDVNTFSFTDGNGLVLNGPYVMRNHSVLSLDCDGTNWVEESRNGI